jgi:acyl-CoA synthetase (AMP-forming)/AMP-acid ligase II/acyl carrier protein
MVPLSQANLAHSAANIQTTLQRTPADLCLNIMPLFHIHGLMAAVLASLAAGAAVACTPGYDASQFFAWLDECRPTWYTAGPTMHQAILARAKANQSVLAATQLRFVRSSSAALPPQILEELEFTFNAPVIEAYGMTEAAHQMASNPLPPAPRKAGSVGPAAGPDVAIMSEDEPELLPPGATGEIVIRGSNVTLGYAGNPEATGRAFTNGWFRTGDQGWIDEDGYLYISGRLKEIINRGGEKVSPREVDEILLAHPAVAQAVTFAMPDPRLGEEVAAAVILRPDHNAGESELRRFVAQRLADFKVPQKILIVDEIPKGPTGKLQRIGLAEKLGLAASGDQVETPAAAEFIAPRTELERFLAEIWQEVLVLEQVGIHDRFLDLGGDSVLATRLVARLRQLLGLELTLLDFFEAPTIGHQVSIIETMLLDEESQT